MHDLSLPRLTSHLLVLISTVSAAILAPVQSLENQNLTAPFDDSSNVVLLNTTALSLNVSNLNEGRPRCSGRMFGTAPNIASCRRAINKITPEQGERTWGMRDDGHSGPEYAVRLPWRWLSRKSWVWIATASFESARVHCSRVHFRGRSLQCSGLSRCTGHSRSRITR